MEQQVIDVNLPECQLVGAYKIDLSQPRFTEIEARKRIMDIVASVPVLDSVAVMNYAVEPQMKVNSYLDDLMEGIKGKDAGPAGAFTAALSRGVKDIRGLLEKIQREAHGEKPKGGFFTKAVSALQELKDRHSEITSFFERMEDDAKVIIGKLTATNSKLDKVADITLENLRELEFHLASGQSIDYRERTLFQKDCIAAKETKDIIAVAELRDRAEHIRGFETRLVHIHLALTDALESIPEIRATQEAGRIQMQNTMNTILFLLPSIKKNILRVVALKTIQDASECNKAQATLDQELRTLGDAAFKEVYLEAKRSQGEGMDRVIALEQSIDNLLNTLEEGSVIDQQNTAKLDAIHGKLDEVKTKLVEGIKVNADKLLTGPAVEQIEDKA